MHTDVNQPTEDDVAKNPVMDSDIGNQALTFLEEVQQAPGNGEATLSNTSTERDQIGPQETIGTES